MKRIFQFLRRLIYQETSLYLLVFCQVVLVLQFLKYPIEIVEGRQGTLSYVSLSPFLEFAQGGQAILYSLIAVAIIILVLSLTALYYQIYSFSQIILEKVFFLLRNLLYLTKYTLTIPFFRLVVRLWACRLSYFTCFQTKHLLYTVFTTICLLFINSILLIQNFFAEPFKNQTQSVSIREFSLQTTLLVTAVLVLQVGTLFDNIIINSCLYAGASLLLLLNALFWNQWYHPTARKWNKVCWIFVVFGNALLIGKAFSLSFGINLLNFIITLVPGIIIGITEYDYQLKDELQNLNKWSGPPQFVKISKRLLKLKCSKERLQVILKHGYAHFHKYRCDKPGCPLVGWDLKDPQIDGLIVKMIKKMMEQALKVFPNNNMIKLQYAKFLIEYDSYENALRQLIQCEELYLQLPLRLQQHILIKNIEEKSAFFLASNPGRTDLVLDIDLDEKCQKIKQLFQQSAMATINFWSLVAQENCDPQKLNQLSIKRVQIDEKVQELFFQTGQKSMKRKILNFYKLYEQMILNKPSQKHQSIGQNDSKQLQGSSSCVLVVNLQKIQPLITMCSVSFSTLLGYFKDQLQHSQLKKILIPLQNCIFQDFKSEKTISLKLFFLHKNGESVSCTAQIYSFNCIKGGLLHFMKLQVIADLKSPILIISKELRIQNFSASAKSYLGLKRRGNYNLPTLYPMLLPKNKLTLGKRNFLLVDLNPQLNRSVIDQNTKAETDLSQILDQENQVIGYLLIIRLSYNHGFIIQDKLIELPAFRFMCIARQGKSFYYGRSKSLANDIMRLNQPIVKSSGRKFEADNKQDSHFTFNQGIKTVRLDDGNIKYIKQGEAVVQDDQNFADSNKIMLAPREEEQIFRSRQSMQARIGQKIFSKQIFFFSRIELILVLLFIFASGLAVYYSYINEDFVQRMGYSNLRAGELAANVQEFERLMFESQGIFPETIKNMSRVTQKISDLTRLQSKGFKDFNTSLGSPFSIYYQQFVSKIYSIRDLELNQYKNQKSIILSIKQQGLFLANELLRQSDKLFNQKMVHFNHFVVFAVGLFFSAFVIFINYKIKKLKRQEDQAMLKIFLGLPDKYVSLYLKSAELFVKTLRNQNQNYQVQDLVEDKKKQPRRKRKKFIAPSNFLDLIVLGVLKALPILVFTVLLLSYSQSINNFIDLSSKQINSTSRNLLTLQLSLISFQKKFAEGQPIVYKELIADIDQQFRYVQSKALSNPYTSNQSTTNFFVGINNNIFEEVSKIFLISQKLASKSYKESKIVSYNLSERLHNQTDNLIKQFQIYLFNNSINLVYILIVCLATKLLFYYLIVEKHFGEELKGHQDSRKSLQLIDPKICKSIEEAHEYFSRDNNII